MEIIKKLYIRNLVLAFLILVLQSCNIPSVETYYKSNILPDQKSNQQIVKHFSEDFAYFYFAFGIIPIRKPGVEEYLYKLIDESKADGICNLTLNSDFGLFQILGNFFSYQAAVFSMSLIFKDVNESNYKYYSPLILLVPNYRIITINGDLYKTKINTDSTQTLKY